MQELTQILTDAVIISAGNICRARDIEISEVADEIADAIKPAILEKLEGLMAEWREALDANVGEGWLRQLLGTQAFEIAQGIVADIANKRARARLEAMGAA